MRLLVSCNECQRQYDATGREIGSRFRCHCSAAVTVEAPQGHDARVVRCSACGAARDAESTECTFCHSRFTLHEQDLHTVCPSCLSRVSDRAKFCHSCGQALGAEMAAGDITDMICPSCRDDHHLASRQLGLAQAAVMECQTCAGLWIASDALTRLTTDVQQQTEATVKPVVQSLAREAKQQLDSQWSYRPCVVCDKLMHRTQYDRGSGVIIDVCRDHGVWFDAHELAEVLRWIRTGGPQQASQRRREEQAAEERRRAATQSTTPAAGGTWTVVDHDDYWAAESALEVLTRMFLR